MTEPEAFIAVIRTTFDIKSMSIDERLVPSSIKKYILIIYHSWIIIIGIRTFSH